MAGEVGRRVGPGADAQAHRGLGLLAIANGQDLGAAEGLVVQLHRVQRALEIAAAAVGAVGAQHGDAAGVDRVAAIAAAVALHPIDVDGAADAAAGGQRVKVPLAVGQRAGVNVQIRQLRAVVAVHHAGAQHVLHTAAGAGVALDEIDVQAVAGARVAMGIEVAVARALVVIQAEPDRQTELGAVADVGQPDMVIVAVKLQGLAVHALDDIGLVQQAAGGRPDAVLCMALQRPVVRQPVSAIGHPVAQAVAAGVAGGRLIDQPVGRPADAAMQRVAGIDDAQAAAFSRQVVVQHRHQHGGATAAVGGVVLQHRRLAHIGQLHAQALLVGEHAVAGLHHQLVDAVGIGVAGGFVVRRRQEAQHAGAAVQAEAAGVGATHDLVAQPRVAVAVLRHHRGDRRLVLGQAHRGAGAAAVAGDHRRHRLGAGRHIDVALADADLVDRGLVAARRHPTGDADAGEAAQVQLGGGGVGGLGRQAPGRRVDVERQGVGAGPVFQLQHHQHRLARLRAEAGHGGGRQCAGRAQHEAAAAVASEGHRVAGAAKLQPHEVAGGQGLGLQEEADPGGAAIGAQRGAQLAGGQAAAQRHIQLQRDRAAAHREQAGRVRQAVAVAGTLQLGVAVDPIARPAAAAALAVQVAAAGKVVLGQQAHHRLPLRLAGGTGRQCALDAPGLPLQHPVAAQVGGAGGVGAGGHVGPAEGGQAVHQRLTARAGRQVAAVQQQVGIA